MTTAICLGNQSFDAAVMHVQDVSDALLHAFLSEILLADQEAFCFGGRARASHLELHTYHESQLFLISTSLDSFGLV